MDEPITHYILEEVIEEKKFLTSLDKWSSVEYANQQAMHIRHAIQRFDELVAAREKK